MHIMLINNVVENVFLDKLLSYIRQVINTENTFIVLFVIFNSLNVQ